MPDFPGIRKSAVSYNPGGCARADVNLQIDPLQAAFGEHPETYPRRMLKPNFISNRNYGSDPVVGFIRVNFQPGHQVPADYTVVMHFNMSYSRIGTDMLEILSERSVQGVGKVLFHLQAFTPSSIG
jgi:hypothetical protein